ncbi:MAG: hypothetical protein V4574_16445 [Pseudomonadota bacterium]
MTVDTLVLDAIANLPDRTERELAVAIYGLGDGYQQRVNGSCRYLAKEGYINRNGRGGLRDPFTYTLTGKLYA